MLHKNQKKRCTAKEALNHPCFEKMLSKSPLLQNPAKDNFNDMILHHTEVVNQRKQKKQ